MIEGRSVKAGKGSDVYEDIICGGLMRWVSAFLISIFDNTLSTSIAFCLGSASDDDNEQKQCISGVNSTKSLRW